MTADLSSVRWRKSSHSGDSIETECVEVADLGGVIGVRDSKDSGGPMLAVTRAGFATFTRRVKSGALDL